MTRYIYMCEQYACTRAFTRTPNDRMPDSCMLTTQAQTARLMNACSSSIIQAHTQYLSVPFRNLYFASAAALHAAALAFAGSPVFFSTLFLVSCQILEWTFFQDLFLTISDLTSPEAGFFAADGLFITATDVAGLFITSTAAAGLPLAVASSDAAGLFFRSLYALLARHCEQPGMFSRNHQLCLDLQCHHHL